MLRALLAAALIAVLTAPAARAQDAYGFTENRKQRWNGTLMDKLPGSWKSRSGNYVFFFSFKTGTLTSNQGLTIVVFNSSGSRFRERWVDHQVVGSNRYSLRGDGRFHINGKKVKELFGVYGSPDWVAFDVDDNGRIYAVRRDGAQTNDLDVTASGTVQLADDGFWFMDIVGVSNTGASLRSDGALFVSGQPDFAMLYFEGGPGQDPDDIDGESLDTIWNRLAVHPITEEVWALRRDGIVQRAPLFPGAQPAEVARLPGVASTGSITLGRLTYPGLGDWVKLAFGEDGRWAALRGDGLVYGTDDTGALVELVHYNGAKNFKTVFSDLTFLGTRMQAIRRDGAVFRDFVTSPVINMQGDGYIRTAFTVADPNIDDIRNAKPVAARYNARIVVGETATIPVLATDTDRPTSQLVIEPDDDLPVGVTYDPDTRSFLVPGGLPAGSYTLAARVDDGVAKPVKTAQKLKIDVPDTDPDKNVRPDVSKVKKLQGLTDVELVVPLIVSDRDGDDVTVTPDLTKGVFAKPGSDASWDDETRTFRWTPRLSDLRKQTAEFLVSDGTSEKRFKLSITVVAPFVSD